jgi:hypothetical protein
MKIPTFTNLAVFIIFFGIALIEALLILGAVGGIIGIYVGFRLNQN